MEKEMKMKHEDMAQRKSEQQKMLEQQNDVLQLMQSQRQQMQDMLSAFIQQSHLQNQSSQAFVFSGTTKKGKTPF